MNIECISVKDKLPEKNGTYFGFIEKCIPCLAYFDGETFDVITSIAGNEHSKVSHWLDIPMHCSMPTSYDFKTK